MEWPLSCKASAAHRAPRGRPFCPSRFAALGVVLAALLAAVTARAAVAPLRIGDGDRLLVLAPHPTDETLAAGGLIQEAVALELPVLVVFATMGDNHEIQGLFTRQPPSPLPGVARSMGPRRQLEALAAATQLGLASNQVVFLGYPDSGLADIWKHRWRDAPPYRSPLTGATAVPYDRAQTPGAAHAGEDLLDDLVALLDEFEPSLVVAPHPADHNADHRALYLFARVAIWTWEELDGDPPPELLAAPVHFTQWPDPRRHFPESPAVPPYFLREDNQWLEFSLAPFQLGNKLDALRRHRSQYRDFAGVLKAAARKTEIFARIPDLELPAGLGEAASFEEDQWLEFSLAPFQLGNKLDALRRHRSQYRDFAGVLKAAARKTEIFARIPDLELPAGLGEAASFEEDLSRFEPDEVLSAELARLPDPWPSLAQQHDAENRAIAQSLNQFRELALSGDGRTLACSFIFDAPLAPGADLAVQLFGCRPDELFADMPKIEVAISSGRVAALRELNEELPSDAIALETDIPGQITLRVPYELLNHPDSLLIGAELSQQALLIDWLPWRVIRLDGLSATPPAPSRASAPPTPAPRAPAPETPAPPPPPPPPTQPEAAAPPADPPPATPRLTPRVRTPRPLPKLTEADEPVFW